MSLSEVRALPMVEWRQWAVFFGRRAQQRELAAGGVR